MTRNYKNVSINFNLDNPKDKVIYEWLIQKRARTAFIKDMLEDIMEDTKVQDNKHDNSLSSDDIEIDI